MQTKKVPMRMCTGCGQMKPKKELVRIVRGTDGEISMDDTGKKPGRGAYLCKNPDCLKKARKARRLERAFKTALPPDVFEKLEEALANGG